MSQPNVNLTELDGALGVLPNGSKILALAGTCSSGPVDTPASFARSTDVQSTFGQGPLVEWACYVIEHYRIPVLLTRLTGSTAGDYDVSSEVATLDAGSTATPAPAATAPYDDYEVYIEIVTGGTVGTAGITYRWSLDGGRTLSPETALATASSIIIPDSGVEIDLGTGDLTAGDNYAIRTTAPQPASADVQSGLSALALSAVAWELLLVANPVDATLASDVDTAIIGMAASGKYRAWIASTRVPSYGESEAAYLGALPTEFAAFVTTHGMLCAGAAKITSPVSGRQYRRHVALAVGSRQASVSEEVDIADVNLGALSGVVIKDSNGNPDEHDETTHPGLDDARFTVLRTWEGYGGVYVNNPRIFSADGSDYEFMPARRVLNLANATVKSYFTRRLSKPLRVNADTGYLLESEARDLETGARRALESVLLAKPKASALQMSISRTDNLLSTKTVTGQGRVIPLGYAKQFDLDMGFYNPALQTVQA